MCPVIKRVPDFDDGKTFIIENVFIDYASVFKPNTKYRPEWAVVIRVPEHLKQEFYEVGFRLKQNPEGIVTLRAKRYCRLDDGTEMALPQVVDCENNQWPESRGLIGNGSRCNVKVRAKYTVYQGVEGLSCFLEGLQVLDHIEYHGEGPTFGAASGSTGGWGGQNFQQQPVQPAPGGFDPNPYTQQAPPAVAPPVQPANEYHPTQVAPVQATAPAPGSQGYAPPASQQQPAYVPSAPVAPPVQPPAQPQQSVPYVPQGTPPGVAVPVGPPAGGNVSQPPVQQGALGAFGQPAAAEPAEEQEYAPPAHSMGEDVPF